MTKRRTRTRKRRGQRRIERKRDIKKEKHTLYSVTHRYLSHE